MPKQTIRRLMPSHADIRKLKALELLGDWIYAANLWHINRYSTSMAFFVGLFLAFIPVPGQMVLAALMAILLRCNLPLSVSLVWITNPVTIPAIFYVVYKVGALIVDVPVKDIEFEVSFQWLGTTLMTAWKPIVVGSLLCGLFFGSLGYFVVNQLWRWRVAYHWHKRKKLRAASRVRPPSDPGSG
jgi:uncharacterized protein (DUF2062 family)